MIILIESLIGIALFTIIMVIFTAKDPLTSVGDYPPAIRKKCIELGLITGLPERISYGKGSQWRFLYLYSHLS